MLTIGTRRVYSELCLIEKSFIFVLVTFFRRMCLKTVFSRLKYPKHLVNSIKPLKVLLTQIFVTNSSFYHHLKRQMAGSSNFTIKDLNLSRYCGDLNLKVHTTIPAVFANRKIERQLNMKETKPPIINQQCVVYSQSMWPVWCGWCGFRRRTCTDNV